MNESDKDEVLISCVPRCEARCVRVWGRGEVVMVTGSREREQPGERERALCVKIGQH